MLRTETIDTAPPARGEIATSVAEDVARAGTRVVYLSLEALRQGQGAHTHVHAVVNGFRAAGLETELLAPTVSSAMSRRGPFRKLWNYVTLSYRGIAALRRADIGYVRSHPAATVFAVADRIMRLPLVHEVNGRTTDIGVTYRLPELLTRLLTGLQNWQYRRAAALIGVTPGLTSWLEGIVGDRAIPVHVVPNGADSDLFRPDAPSELQVDGSYALFFGGLVSWHGVETMLRAVNEPAWPADCKLVIAGDGQNGALVRRAAATDRRIVALGYQPRDVLAGLAARARVGLCPIEPHGSRDVGGVAPLKLYEMMAAGRPVIVTDLPFQADLVERHRCGIVIPHSDAAALAGAVADIASDTDSANAMGKAGRHAVETLYDWRFRVAETVALVRQCARDRT